ncbi:serine/threonine-protein kinase [Spirillospora sp. CA-255316]
MPSPLRDNDPRHLGEYRIVGRLGRGGMGTVFQGEDAAGRPVAVKVINAELADEPAFHERFRREVTAARQVRRFCTAPVLDARLDGEQLYVVTEYVAGPSLDEAVKENGPLHGGGLDGLAVGIATALGAIHDAGIVHRDLKPSNVLLSPTGPRVIDFGIARALDAVDGPTRTGQIVGTPAYIAPEILRGEEITPAADVFSWGCVIAFAGTGRPPFSDTTVPAIMRRVMSEPPVLDGLDPALRDIVTAALDKDPRRRPTAHDLLARLTGRTDRPGTPPEETRQDAAAATATATEPPESGRSDGRRRRLLIGAGAVVAVALVGGATALYAFRDSNGVPENTRSIFTDDFSSQQSGWGKRAYIPGPVIGYGFKGDGYGLDAGGGNPVRLRMSPVTREQMPEPVLASVTVKAAQGPPYGMFGLICAEQYDNGASGYRFLVRRDGRGAVVRKATKDRGSKELLRLDEEVKGFDTAGPNRVQIACEPDGNQIWLRMWVNGELAADIGDTDRPMLKGNVGLIAAQETGATELRVDFDDFEMAEILY